MSTEMKDFRLQYFACFDSVRNFDVFDEVYGH
jgi:hypothetical protein